MKENFNWHTSPEDGEEFQDLIENLYKRSFERDNCFLCGISLQKAESSSEHVIPKWAQNRYDLWNQKLFLLNKTLIPYRQLTIPCCAECNKYRLQPIEISISSATLSGPEAVRKLGEKVLFLWLGKIFYGILYKELFLFFERKSSDGITIINPYLLQKYKSHLFFLQQARRGWGGDPLLQKTPALPSTRQDGNHFGKSSSQ